MVRSDCNATARRHNLHSRALEDDATRRRHTAGKGIDSRTSGSVNVSIRGNSRNSTILRVQCNIVWQAGTAASWGVAKVVGATTDAHTRRSRREIAEIFGAKQRHRSGLHSANAPLGRRAADIQSVPNS
jgi:hypothetical protein